MICVSSMPNDGAVVWRWWKNHIIIVLHSYRNSTSCNYDERKCAHTQTREIFIRIFVDIIRYTWRLQRQCLSLKPPWLTTCTSVLHGSPDFAPCGLFIFFKSACEFARFLLVDGSSIICTRTSITMAASLRRCQKQHHLSGNWMDAAACVPMHRASD